MKNIYILYNQDICETLCASEDRELLQEVMCDMFMEDVLFQWYWDLQWSVYEIKDLPERANMIWDDMIEWYWDYIIIEEVEVI